MPNEDAGIDAGEPDAGHSATGLVSLPERVAFGNVGMIAGAQLSVTRKLSLFYAGAGQDLVIEGWEVSGEEVSVTGPELPVRLEARAGANVAELEVTLTPTSLGAKSFGLRIRTDDPERPEHTVPITAQVVPTPDCTFSAPEQFTFNLGQLAPPDYRDLKLQIINAGTRAIDRCHFTAIEVVSDAGISLVGGPIAERVIEPGAALELVIRVPASSATGVLEFDVNSSSKPYVQIPITVTKPQPANCITIAPDQLDFGELMAGCSSQTRTFSVYNTCSTEVRIHSFQMTNVAGQPAGGPNCPGTAACPEFHLVQAPPIPVGGLPLAAGAPAPTFQVKYRPIDAGPDVGAFELSWSIDGGDLHSELVSFSGRGTSRQVQTDTYVQDAPPQLDVLFVLDDSPSMANEQSSVAANLVAYLQHLEATWFDFQLGVISADPAATAELRSGASHPDRVLTRASSNLQPQFAAKIDVGTTGSGSPRCLEQAVNALTPPLSTGVNAGFLRTGAQLKVVCVTDSTDHSPLTVSSYVASLNALKQTASMVDFDAAAGFTTSCPGDQGRLADAVTQTGGVKADLCSANWSQALHYLSFPVFPPPGYPGLMLSALPDFSQGPLQVTVDGQPVTAVDASGATVWQYDPASNLLTFTPGHEPAVGQTVTVTYFTQCYP